jgi:hypothetical protein
VPEVSRRRVAAWLLVLPLMVAGSQLAHMLAYRLVYPEAQVRVRELLATGHGYMTYAPLLFGMSTALELVAFGSLVVERVRRRQHTPMSPWVFALLPPLGFALQEFLERWLAGSPFPWWMALQPTFRIGLLLQLPFALLAFLTARLLLRVADGVASALRGRAELPAPAGVLRQWSALVVWPPRMSVLADGHAGRGPPSPVAPVAGALDR